VARTPKESLLTRKRFFPLTAVGVLLFASLTWLAVNAGALREYIQAYEARTREQERIDELQQRIRILTKQQRGLKYNGFEAERRARERLGLHKPGEQVIYLKPATDDSAAVFGTTDPAVGVAAPDAGSSPTAALAADTTPAAASRSPVTRKNARPN
jgi:cell division protein FtsB